jgi:enoyl-CoA hydratase/carnithine racemase
MAAMPVGAEQAKHIGLVHEVYAEETFLDDVYAFCRHLMAIQAEALGLAKLTVDIYADVQDRTVQRHVDRLAVWSTFAEFEKSMQRFGHKPDAKS